MRLCRVPWPWHSVKFFQKKNLCRVPHDLAPGKEITKKNKKTLCWVPPRCDTRQRNYKKNKNIFVGCLPGTAPDKENLKKKLKKSLPGASDMAPGKARDDGAGAVTTTFLCRVPGLHSAKSLPGAR